MRANEFNELKVGDTIAYMTGIGVATTGIIKNKSKDAVFVSAKRIPGTGVGYIDVILTNDELLKKTTIKL